MKLFKTKPYVKPTNFLEYGSFQNKYSNSTIQRLIRFPNLGVGFKITNRYDKNVSYLIDSVKLIGTRSATLYGLRYKNGVPDNKITEIFSANQYSITSIAGTGIQNGNIYDIKDMYERIKKKKALLSQRDKLFGYKEEKTVKDKSGKDAKKK